MTVFSKRERWALGFFLLLGCVGALSFTLLFNEVSPEASLQFQVSRSEAKELGESFLNRLDYDLSEYRSSIVFISDQDEAVYLQKQLGTGEANQFFNSEYAPWYWKIRWFRFLEDEEFALAITPTGHLVGFYHNILEEQGEGSLTKSQAAKLAEPFLETHLGVHWEQWELISHEQKEKPNRRDHLFKWAKLGIPLEEGKLILSCGIQGNQVGSFSKYILIPRSFTAEVEQSEDNRNLLTLIFKLFYLALGIIVGAEFLLFLKRHQIRWKVPIVLALGMFFLSLASELNSLSLEWSLIDTRESFSHFLLTEFLSSLLTAFWSGLFILMVAVAAENSQKGTWPKMPRLKHVFSRDYFLSKNFLQSIWIGYSLGALQLGYVAVYYLLSHRFFGGWSPPESPYINVASSFIPWIFPLTVGLSAAFNEELFFRMFSISFLKRWLVSPILAVGIPALIWGFLHSNYYVEPIYSRGVELALVGVVLGMVYLKYGILPVILCHYTYNSVLGFVPLLRSESLFFKTSGWISLFWILLPACLALLSFVLIKRRKKSAEFIVVEEEPPKTPSKLSQYLPFKWGNRLSFEFFGLPDSDPEKKKAPFQMEKSLLAHKKFLAVIGLSLAVLILLFWFRPVHFGPSPELKLKKSEVAKLADAFVEENKIENPFDKKRVVFYREPYSKTGTFLVREVGLTKSNEILEREQASFLNWGVVYYKLKEPQGITLSFDQQGRVIGLQTRRKDSQRLGGSLSLEEAKEKAFIFLKSQRPADWEEFQFVGEKSTLVEERASHAFIWEKNIPEIANLKSRVKILIRGAQLGGYEERFVLPETFLRKMGVKKGRETFLKAIMSLLILVGSILIALDAIFKFRRGEYSWSLALKVGLVFLFCDLVQEGNAFPQIWLSIVEANPLSPWVLLIEKGINILISELVTFGFFVFFAAFSLALIQEKFGSFTFSSLFLPKKWGEPQYFQGAVLALLIFPILWLAQQYLFTLEMGLIPQTLRSSYPFFQKSTLNTYFPLIGIMASAIKATLLYSLTLGAMFAFLWKVFKKPMIVFLFFVLTSSFQFISSQVAWSQIAIQVLLQLLVLAGLFLILKKLIRFNLFFFICFFWIRSLFSHLPLLFASDPILWWQGFFAVILLFLPLLGVLWASWKANQHPLDRGTSQALT